MNTQTQLLKEQMVLEGTICQKMSGGVTVGGIRVDTYLRHHFGEHCRIVVSMPTPEEVNRRTTEFIELVEKAHKEAANSTLVFGGEESKVKI